MIDVELVESSILEVFSFAEVEVAQVPCKIAFFEICPCGVSEATFKEEELLVEDEAEAPFVEDFPVESVVILFSPVELEVEVPESIFELSPFLFLTNVSVILTVSSLKGSYLIFKE